jgi:hypothetical protein
MRPVATCWITSPPRITCRVCGCGGGVGCVCVCGGGRRATASCLLPYAACGLLGAEGGGGAAVCSPELVYRPRRKPAPPSRSPGDVPAQTLPAGGRPVAALPALTAASAPHPRHPQPLTHTPSAPLPVARRGRGALVLPAAGGGAGLLPLHWCGQPRAQPEQQAADGGRAAPTAQDQRLHVQVGLSFFCCSIRMVLLAGAR